MWRGETEEREAKMGQGSTDVYAGDWRTSFKLVADFWGVASGSLWFISIPEIRHDMGFSEDRYQ